MSGVFTANLGNPITNGANVKSLKKRRETTRKGQDTHKKIVITLAEKD